MGSLQSTMKVTCVQYHPRAEWPSHKCTHRAPVVPRTHAARSPLAGCANSTLMVRWFRGKSGAGPVAATLDASDTPELSPTTARANDPPVSSNCSLPVDAAGESRAPAEFRADSPVSMTSLRSSASGDFASPRATLRTSRVRSGAMSGASPRLEEPPSRVSDQPAASLQPEASGNCPTTRRLSEILSDSSSSAARPATQRLSEMMSDSPWGDSSGAGGSFMTPLPSPAAQETPRPGRALPQWAAELVASGEAVACLSLAGNHTVTLEAEAVGSRISYSVHAMEVCGLPPWPNREPDPESAWTLSQTQAVRAVRAVRGGRALPRITQRARTRTHPVVTRVRTRVWVAGRPACTHPGPVRVRRGGCVGRWQGQGCSLRAAPRP